MVRSRIVRERELRVSQTQETSKDEQKMTQSLIYIIAIATVTTLIKISHYIMRNILLAKLHYDNQEVESSFRDLDLKSGVNQEDVKSDSFAAYTLNQFDIAMIVTREVGRIFLVINASVNVFITLWSCKKVREELFKMVLPIKKILSRFFIDSKLEMIEMSTIVPGN